MSTVPVPFGAKRGEIATPYAPSARHDLVGPAPDVRRSMVIALLTIVFGFGGFFGWAALFRLESATVAPGVVAVQSHRKLVQHLEGGIIKAVRVANGDRVRAGDPLVELEDAQARSNHGQTLGLYRAALARQARLRAEAGGRSTIEVPAILSKDQGDPDVARVIDAQRWTFDARRGAHASAIAVKRQTIADLKADSAAATEQLVTTERQIAKIVEEISDTRTLLNKGLVPKPRLLALERAEAELHGRKAELRGRLNRNREALTTVDVQIADLEATRQKDIAAELEAVDREVADLSQRLAGLQDILQRVIVRAPQDGIVVNLQVFTPGGVIRGGDPILELVPGNDALVIDAKLSPMDIDNVHPGLKARIRLTAYRQQTTPTVMADVIDVSADRLTDQAGNSYYNARLQLNPAELEALPNVQLYPGMPVDAMIITGEHTVLNYLLSPITNGFAHALREQ